MAGCSRPGAAYPPGGAPSGMLFVSSRIKREEGLVWFGHLWGAQCIGLSEDILEFQFTPHWISFQPENSQGRSAETTEFGQFGRLAPQSHKSHCHPRGKEEAR